MVLTLKADSSQEERTRYKEFLKYFRKRLKALTKEEKRFRETIIIAKKINNLF